MIKVMGFVINNKMIEDNVFCIIVTYNAMKWIDKCLSSLNDSTIPVKVVIVDNCSKDNTVEYVRTKYPSVYLIINNVNRGFGQANNQGIEYAYKQGATHFFLLNQDAWVEKDAIEKLVKIQNKYNLALVSPIHMNGMGDKMDYSYFVKIMVDEKNNDFLSDLFNKNLKPYYKVYKINAAAWMLSKKTIEEIGGFDPIYFHYGEDGNYCQRVNYHKKDVVFVPDSVIHHDRLLQGNMKVYNKNFTLMWLLFLYTDINSSYFKITMPKIKFHIGQFILSIKLLLKLRIKDLFHLVKAHLKFILLYGKCRRSMSANKTIAHNWLNI